MNWNNIILPRVSSGCYHGHPVVAQRTPVEYTQIRPRHSATIDGEEGRDKDIPRPVASVSEATFPEWLIGVLRQKGFEEPTSNQVQVWPAALRSHDLVGTAEAGSGKTIAYVPPMLAHSQAQEERHPGEGPVGIVVVPAQELCSQAQENTQEFPGVAGGPDP